MIILTIPFIPFYSSVSRFFFFFIFCQFHLKSDTCTMYIVHRDYMHSNNIMWIERINRCHFLFYYVIYIFISSWRNTTKTPCAKINTLSWRCRDEPIFNKTPRTGQAIYVISSFYPITIFNNHKYYQFFTRTQRDVWVVSDAVQNMNKGTLYSIHISLCARICSLMQLRTNVETK